MKKILLISFTTFLFGACGIKYNSDLEKMGKSLESHFKYNDQKQNTVTTLELLQPLSYEKLEDNQKEKPEDTYLTRFYVRGKWNTIGSSLIYNMNDTISCYFDKDLKYLRMNK